jgi:small-conductance mechanosensitive channel
MSPETWKALGGWLAAINGPVLWTIALVFALIVIRYLAGRSLSVASFLGQDVRLRALVAVRNLALFAGVVGVGAIWAQQVQALLLSVLAVGAAGAIALKEVLMCLAGGLLRTTTNLFGVGDRIEVNGFRGDVIDLGPMTTTLLEVGPGKESHQWTGRSVSLPNSLFLLHTVANESFTDEWVLHPFIVSVARNERWRDAEAALLTAAHEQCGPYLEQARAFMEQRARRHSLATMSVDPRVSIRLGDTGKIEMLVRIPVPRGQRGRIEQAILHRFLETTLPPVAPGVSGAPAPEAV